MRYRWALAAVGVTAWAADSGSPYVDKDADPRKIVKSSFSFAGGGD